MSTLLITADALRADHLKQYGYHRDTMPVIDRVASNGTILRDVFSNATHTLLSVPSLLTSRHNGLRQMANGPTVASVYRDDGYSTAAFHSNPVISENFKSIHGFSQVNDIRENEGDSSSDETKTGQRAREVVTTVRERIPELADKFLGERKSLFARQYNAVLRILPDRWLYEPTPYAHASVITDRALNWLGDNPGKFFLWVHYMESHRPYGYSPGESFYLDDKFSTREIFDLMAKAGQRPDSVTEDDKRRMIDLYDSDLRYLSRQVQRLLDEVEKRTPNQEVNVVFTADHGEEFGEHGMYYHRNYPYDEQLRVPFVCRLPSLPIEKYKGQKELLDLAPTLLNASGIPVPQSFDGRALDTEGNDSVVATAHRDELSVAVRHKGNWKYIETEHGHRELYNLTSDPSEQRSVVNNHPKTVNQLQGTLPEEAWKITDSIAIGDAHGSDDQTVNERLSNLGYTD